MDKSREQFEAWWENEYHNGNPPRFGWENWRDGEGYKIDDDESELDSMWNAWQASRAALCPKCGGTGMADSGGVQPWGEPIEIPCDCPFGDNK